MTPTRLEHRITAALHDHAEEMMSRTDTESELRETLHRGSEAIHRRNRRWVVGGLAAVAVVAAGAVLWPAGHETRSATSPTTPTTSTAPMNADEQLAHDFVSAYAAFDRRLAASFVGDDATLTLGSGRGPDGWKRENRLDEALGFDTHVDSCSQIETLAPDGTQVGCLYTSDLLGLAELGRGPFPGNLFTVTVRDGKVVDFMASAGANDYYEVGWDPFWAWVEDTHASDVPTLRSVEDPGLRPKQVDRVLRLWKQVGQEYVAALRAGTAD
ncbi:MAG TPA: hypothetical protein VGD39_02995 [Nocardioides sp.]